MSSRNGAFLALCIATAAVLGSQTLSYGLVYPSQSAHSKVPVLLGTLCGVLSSAVAIWLSARAKREASGPSERFMALLSLVLGCFFLFVVVAGFGIPVLFLAVRD